MADGWKAIERKVAELTGGVRAWDSRDEVDVLVPDDKNPEWAIEVKHRQRAGLAQIEEWVRYNQTKADGRGIKGALVLKRKAGSGKQTPFLVVMELQ